MELENTSLDGLSYSEIRRVIGAFKAWYKGVLCSFSIYQLKLENRYIRSVKNYIYYKIGLLEWQADRIWEFMNDDIDYLDLYRNGSVY